MCVCFGRRDANNEHLWSRPAPPRRVCTVANYPRVPANCGILIQTLSHLPLSSKPISCTQAYTQEWKRAFGILCVLYFLSFSLVFTGLKHDLVLVWSIISTGPPVTCEASQGVSQCPRFLTQSWSSPISFGFAQFSINSKVQSRPALNSRCNVYCTVARRNIFQILATAECTIFWLKPCEAPDMGLKIFALEFFQKHFGPGRLAFKGGGLASTNALQVYQTFLHLWVYLYFFKVQTIFQLWKP